MPIHASEWQSLSRLVKSVKDQDIIDQSPILSPNDLQAGSADQQNRPCSGCEHHVFEVGCIHRALWPALGLPVLVAPGQSADRLRCLPGHRGI